MEQLGSGWGVVNVGRKDTNFNNYFPPIIILVVEVEHLSGITHVV